MLQQASRARLRTSYLEVEKKFKPTAILEDHLKSKTRQLLRPGHRSALGATTTGPNVRRLPDRKIRDVYYDSKDQLSSKGIWIRFRETQTVGLSTDLCVVNTEILTAWEAKVQVAGTYTDMQAIEIEGKEQVKQFLHEQAPEVDLRSLDVMVDLHTFRRSWLVQEEETATSKQKAFGDVREVKMRIDLDDVIAPAYVSSQPGASFFHQVGEVEMTGTITHEDTEESTDFKREAAKPMNARIREFFERYEDMFSGTSTKGKLSAFFAWKEASGAKLAADGSARPALMGK